MKSINPYSVYFFSWTIVIILYFLNWSSLYPRLKFPLLFFFIVTGIISCLISFAKKNSNKLKIVKLSSPERFRKLFIWYLVLNYILLIAEFKVNGGIPLLMYSTAEIVLDTDYMTFGIPVVRVFVINSFSVIFVFSTYCLASQKGNKAKIWKWLMLLSIIPPIICVQRGIALNQLFCGFIVYLMFNKIKMKNVLQLVFLLSLIMYGFGVIGNMRSAHGDDSYMNDFWGANKNFEKAGIPNPFFWAYIYATSPLANLQNAIDKKTIESYEFNDFVVLDILPQIISKNILVKSDGEKYFVSPNLVVCTTFYYSYLKLGWMGMVLMFAYIVFFISFFLYVVRSNSPFRIPLIVCLCQIVFFGIFDNMVHYMGMLPQLVVYLILSWSVKKSKILKSV